MRSRVTIATVVLAIAALSGCGSDGSDGAAVTPGSSATASPTGEAPSGDPQDQAAAALKGDWEIPAEDYVLHLLEDGTFVQDYMGIKEFRTGTYSVEGDTISLVGGDGDTDEGTIVGETLEFTLGTATRVG